MSLPILYFRTRDGKPLSFGSVRVNIAGSGDKAALFSSYSGKQRVANPVRLDINGMARFFISENVDVIVSNNAGVMQDVFRGVRESLNQHSVMYEQQEITVQLTAQNVGTGSATAHILAARPLVDDGAVVNANHALPIGFSDIRYANIGGDDERPFYVGDSDADSAASRLDNALQRYALLNGNSTQVFSVAAASSTTHALRRSQGDGRYALIEGSDVRRFAVSSVPPFSDFRVIARSVADSRYLALNGGSNVVHVNVNADNTNSAVTTIYMSQRFIEAADIHTKQQSDTDFARDNATTYASAKQGISLPAPMTTVFMGAFTILHSGSIARLRDPIRYTMPTLGSVGSIVSGSPATITTRITRIDAPDEVHNTNVTFVIASISVVSGLAITNVGSNNDTLYIKGTVLDIRINVTGVTGDTFLGGSTTGLRVGIQINSYG